MILNDSTGEDFTAVAFVTTKIVSRRPTLWDQLWSQYNLFPLFIEYSYLHLISFMIIIRYVWFICILDISFNEESCDF